MKLYRTGLLLLAVLCTIPVFAGQPPRLKVGSSSGIFGPVTNWTYETFAEAKRAGIDAIEISASTLFLNKEMTDDRQIEARCRQLKRDLKRAGIEIWSVHMPFGREIDLSQTDEAVRQRSVYSHRGSCCSTRAGISGTGSATRGSRSWCARSGSCFPMRRRSAPGW